MFFFFLKSADVIVVVREHDSDRDRDREHASKWSSIDGARHCCRLAMVTAGRPGQMRPLNFHCDGHCGNDGSMLDIRGDSTVPYGRLCFIASVFLKYSIFLVGICY